VWLATPSGHNEKCANHTHPKCLPHPVFSKKEIFNELTKLNWVWPDFWMGVVVVNWVWLGFSMGVVNWVWLGFLIGVVNWVRLGFLMGVVKFF